MKEEFAVAINMMMSIESGINNIEQHTNRKCDESNVLLCFLNFSVAGAFILAHFSIPLSKTVEP